MSRSPRVAPAATIWFDENFGEAARAGDAADAGSVADGVGWSNAGFEDAGLEDAEA